MLESQSFRLSVQCSCHKSTSKQAQREASAQWFQSGIKCPRSPSLSLSLSVSPKGKARSNRGNEANLPTDWKRVLSQPQAVGEGSSGKVGRVARSIREGSTSVSEMRNACPICFHRQSSTTKDPSQPTDRIAERSNNSIDSVRDK